MLESRPHQARGAQGPSAPLQEVPSGRASTLEAQCGQPPRNMLSAWPLGLENRTTWALGATVAPGHLLPDMRLASQTQQSRKKRK